MRRIICASMVALLASLAGAGAAAAKPRPVTASAWAAKYGLNGQWRQRDPDHDGLTNLAEFKARTNPRRADTDRDGLKDGAEVKVGLDPLDPDTDGDGIADGSEIAGTVVSYDGESLTLRLPNGKLLVGAVDSDTAFDCWASDDDPSDADAAQDSSCDDSLLEPGVVVDEAAGDDAGDGFVFTSIELIDDNSP
jgi:hypothetical protein